MIPRLYISAWVVYVVSRSLILTTSGATYPGVPHLAYKNLGKFYFVDNPKSAKISEDQSF